MKQCIIKYNEALKYINEGDVLLFRGNSFVSAIIQAIGEGYYSHVGMASWVFNDKGEKGFLECIEFREWIGSRAINLKNYIDDNPGRIDVFRPIPKYSQAVYSCKQRKLDVVEIVYDGKKLTNEFRELTGLPYGWNRILWLAKFHLFGLRLFNWQAGLEDIESKHELYPVCSTVVAYLFAKHYTRLLHYRSSSRTEPSDVARSPILNYMFTLVP